MGFFAMLPLVVSIVELAVPAIRTVERLIRGSGRSSEKREAAATEVVGGLQDLFESFEQYENYELSGIDRDELQALLADPDALFEDIAAVNDSIVTLLNHLGVLELEEEDAPF